MRFEPNKIFLIENRSINSELLFRNPEDYNCFLHKIRKEIVGLAEILAWNLMPDRIKLVVSSNEAGCTDACHLGDKSIQLLTRKIGTLLSSYAQYFNKKYKRTGSLFCQKTKSTCLDPNNPALIGLTTANSIQELLIENFIQLHNEPVIYKLVAQPEEWMYSSLKDFLGQRHGTLCNFELTCQLMQMTAKQVRALFKKNKDYQLLNEAESITLS